MDMQPKMTADKLNVKTRTAETISQLAHRHLTDPNHTTSDEELLYATVELTKSVEPAESLFEIDNTPIFPPSSRELKMFADEEKAQREQSPAPPNPYNIYS